MIHSINTFYKQFINNLAVFDHIYCVNYFLLSLFINVIDAFRISIPFGKIHFKSPNNRKLPVVNVDKCDILWCCLFNRFLLFYKPIMALPSISSLKKHRNPYDTLERMLNKTTITTQRIAHRHIVGEFPDKQVDCYR